MLAALALIVPVKELSSCLLLVPPTFDEFSSRNPNTDTVCRASRGIIAVLDVVLKS